LIAFLVGVSHAVANRAWGWVGFGFLSPPLAVFILLVCLGTHLSPFDVSILLFLLTFVVGFFLLPMICLAYARSLEG
jgi:hypothetical protein